MVRAGILPALGQPRRLSQLIQFLFLITQQVYDYPQGALLHKYHELDAIQPFPAG